MTRNARALTLATLVSAALAIAGAAFALNLPAFVFVFKPLTTALIVAYAWRRDGGPPAARRYVLLGLLLSWCGDVALLWPQQGFLPGLVAFLLAHLAYLLAFTRVARPAARLAPFVLYALVAGAILWQLWPGVPPALRLPVVAYVVFLSAMAAQAAVVWRMSNGNAEARRARVLALGGALFVASDALLAANKFHTAIPAASLWILTTYWAAQWCIATWLKPREFG
ncbi:lysoplasmalogenase [Piscinibacter sp.]|uniref:lysoplasmalogenase n=1 Tax=Piscinibacter sp. TaxID=1903157 RepID=UPI002D1D8B0E|nr:lysoplasmalogenase [Albitalea sp.]HUG24271.1 lysoplasmalogenase [Albitalea sp.]